MADAEAIETEFAALKKAGNVAVIGEIGTQYVGVSPDGPRLEPLWLTGHRLSRQD